MQTEILGNLLDIKNLGHEFINGKGISRRVIDGLSIGVPKGEIVVLLGPSGCGKSTVLRAVAGLLKPTDGELIFEGSAITGPSKDRAMVFQNYACFPFLTVEDNVSFGLTLGNNKSPVYKEHTDRMLKTVGISHLKKSYPAYLSGGERQRVAIARSLAMQPKLLLMDEPFSSLDGSMRRQLQDLLLFLRENEAVTFLFVTHSVEEAVYLGSKIYVMSAGPTEAKPVPATILSEVPVRLPRKRSQRIKAENDFENIEREVNELMRMRAYDSN